MSSASVSRRSASWYREPFLRRTFSLTMTSLLPLYEAGIEPIDLGILPPTLITEAIARPIALEHLLAL